MSRARNERPRIVLADEQSMLCDLLARILEPEFDVVQRVPDGRALIEAARLKPDAIILDVELPMVTGIEAARAIRRIAPATKLVVLTMIDDERVARSALDAGVSGYLLKSAALDEVPAALRDVLAGRTHIAQVISARLAASSGRPPLTAREHQVLALLVDGMPMREAGLVLNLTPRTIAFHKYRIMKKLGVRSSAELIRTAISLSLAR